MAELEIKPSAASRIRVAAVILSALGITATLVFLLSGGGPDSFARKARIHTYMPDVTGLAKNSEVRLNGIRIGFVEKAEISGYLDPQRAVRVDMRIVSRFLRWIPADAQTSVGSDTLVGTRFVAIGPGKSSLFLADNGILPSEPLQLAGDRADLVLLMKNELKQVDDLLIQVSSPATPVGHFIMGEEEYNNFLAKVSAFDRSMHVYSSTESAAGQAVFSKELYQQLRAPLTRVDDTLAAIQRGEGSLGRLYASDDQYNRIVADLKSLRSTLAEANSGKGRFGALIQNDASYRQIQSMLASTDAMLSALQSGQGNLAHLLRDPQLYESLNGSLRNMQTLLQDVRTNPGKYLRYKVF